MTTYESTSGSIVHVELDTADPEATRAFLEDAFGWSFEVMEEMEYMSFRAPSPPGGGIMLGEQQGPFTPPPTLLYVAVDDLEETNEEITDAGGEILVEAMEVPEMGLFTIFADPGGVVQAAWEDRYEGEPPEGGWPEFTDAPEPGSITHFELYSEDPEATQRFYEDVFGWEFESVGVGEYTLARPPTPPFGGLMPANEEMPAGTLLYLLVEDAEDASRAIAEADGTVLRDPFEVEGWGTMALFRAPGDLVLALWESAHEADAGEDAAEHEVSG
jgi:predicted enzyme related to lactoylglutathione lyase